MKYILRTIILFSVIVLAFGTWSYIYITYQNYTFQNYWEIVAHEKPQPNEITYVALGDSTALGIGASDPTQGYVGQFAKKIEMQTGVHVHVINLGTNGAVFKDILEQQIPKLKQYKPDIVTVAIGGNDRLADDKRVQVTQNLPRVAAQLPKGSFIADLPMNEQRSIVSRKLVKDLAKKYNLHYVSLSETTDFGTWNMNMHAIDYLHPNTQQYTIWTDVFWDAYQKSGS